VGVTVPFVLTLSLAGSDAVALVPLYLVAYVDIVSDDCFYFSAG
jgi:hypothetical protein